MKKQGYREALIRHTKANLPLSLSLSLSPFGISTLILSLLRYLFYFIFSFLLFVVIYNVIKHVNNNCRPQYLSSSTGQPCVWLKSFIQKQVCSHVGTPTFPSTFILFSFCFIWFFSSIIICLSVLFRDYLLHYYKSKLEWIYNRNSRLIICIVW